MQKTKMHTTTIILLISIIFSGGYGIVSLLQYKANKINSNDKELIFYKQCSSDLNKNLK